MRRVLVGVLCFMSASVHAQESSAEAKAGLKAQRLAEQARIAQERASQRGAGEMQTLACPPERRVTQDVDLDQPGALADLRRANRMHFVMLEAIRKPQPLGSIAARLNTQMNACEVAMLRFFRTSLPAQALISFVVDDTRYRTTVYVDDSAPGFVPVPQAEKPE